MAEKLKPSSGNVFRDLGFSKPEAENLRVRTVLMSSLRSIIDQEGLTQIRAAKLFGVSQRRLSDLVRDKIELFSIDSLVNMLIAAGRRVDVSVRSGEDRPPEVRAGWAEAAQRMAELGEDKLLDDEATDASASDKAFREALSRVPSRKPLPGDELPPELSKRKK